MQEGGGSLDFRNISKVQCKVESGGKMYAQVRLISQRTWPALSGLVLWTEVSRAPVI